MTAPVQPDWDAGRYETFAAELAPSAGRLVELAAPASGERVVDLATPHSSSTTLPSLPPAAKRS